MKRNEQDASLWLAIPISFVTWSATFLFTVVAVIIDVLILLPVSYFKDKGTRSFVHYSAVYWARCIIACTPIWRSKVDGLKHIKPGQQYLVMCNHQSLLDILIVAARLPVLFRFLAKKELFSIPFMGWHMSMAKYIPVERTSKTSRHRALMQIDEWLARGSSILFFPEGTRTPDGEIHDFRPAAFKIASDRGVTILPIVVDGPGTALPKKSLLLKKPTCFYLSILEPVPMKDVPADQINDVMHRVRESMIAKLKQIRETHAQGQTSFDSLKH